MASRFGVRIGRRAFDLDFADDPGWGDMRFVGRVSHQGQVVRSAETMAPSNGQFSPGSCCMNSRRTSPGSAPPSAGWLVLCLIGLDYFSTLAYLPSLAVEAAGPLAPFAALLVVAVTLLAALPVYLYVVGRSPHGRGGTGVIERLVPGWAGKLLVLLLLAFVATDYVVTQNL